ncbi:arylesterase [Cocleimonas sp. KMM 6892]|uniref:arylesterase n=1 Tax=unclassified Cocleimonas TaxID=2639732 RepID=UPI002DB58C10|nr:MULTISPECIES: arylesterase [unclassified Cocleimonas]MEB8431111.1 arylesterase [Cocleimonas sp. KMM 6892]MEC4714117.1 arylesterase [Cocleimonas sp. KMM 6895]MEC4743448.1 arylesterase [Cocleimonas sp. KMM 6896]
MLNRILISKSVDLKRSWVSIFALLFVTLLLQACGSEKLLSRVSESGVILAFGDSLTSGVGVKPENSYPSVLARLTGRQVVNAGISGEVTADGLARLAAVIEKTNPELMILLEGGNDILRNKSLSETKKNLSAMINLAKAEGIQVVLVGVPKKQLFSDAAPLYSELAEEHRVPLEAEIISSLIRKPKFKSDSVHFNEAGYSKMAEEIQQLLKDHGAL